MKKGVIVMKSHIKVLENILQGSPDWIALRRTKITSTDSAAIMGLNPWKSAYQLFLEKTGVEEIEPPNAKMLIGSANEELARADYIKLSGIDVEPIVCLSEKNPWLMASLDGFCHKTNKAVEIKCGKKAFQNAKKGHLELYYKCQLQHVMAVCNLDVIDFFCWWEGQSILKEIKRDEEFIKEMLIKDKQFYDDILNLKVPLTEDVNIWAMEDTEWNEWTKKTWEETLKEIK